MKTILISGGNINPDFALDFIKKHPADHIIAIDKGLMFCHDNGIQPDYIVGDFDSLPSGILETYEQNPDIQVKRLTPEKDDSDTESAMHLAMEIQSRTIYLLGATGTRLDHMMANLQLLAYARRQGIQMYLVDEHNLATVLTQPIVLKKEEQYGTFVSFFSLGDEVLKLTLKGFKYPLTNHHLTNISCGLSLSNEIMEEEAEVTFESGILLMIQSKD